MINKAVVFGSGSMGSGIAALLASNNIHVTLLDVPHDGENRNQRAQDAIELQIKRGGFYHQKFAANITPGNSEDDLGAIADADWVIEAIFEDVNAKRQLYRSVAPHLAPHALLTSNTSTIQREDLIAELPAELQERFAITHFFNPPRVMPLVELIGPEAALQTLTEVIEKQLGKAALPCRDTPGFIANRIGTFWMAAGAHIAKKHGLRYEDADARYAKALNIPRTGIFGLFDYIGMQLIPGVWGGLAEKLPAEDAYHDYDVVNHPTFQGLLERGWTGRTGPSGFYRGRDEVLTDDFEYEPVQPVNLDPAPTVENDPFVQELFLTTLRYCCDHADSIADSLQDIDHGMQWGYSWKEGPFGQADRIGLDLIKKLYGDNPPALLLEALEHGSFLPSENPEPPAPTFEVLDDDIAVLRLDSKLGIITNDVISALEDAAKQDLRGLVIINDDPRAFSAGAHLPTLQSGDVEFIDRGLAALRNLKYAPFPVVAAVDGVALGGGAELMLHADAVVAHVDARIGFPERNVGLFPGWGGPLEHLRRLIEANVDSPHQKAFDFSMSAKQLRGAYPAQDAHLLRESDRIVSAHSRVLPEALALARELAEGYQPPSTWQVPAATVTIPDEDNQADQNIAQALADCFNTGTNLDEDDWLQRALQLCKDVFAQPANQERAASCV